MSNPRSIEAKLVNRDWVTGDSTLDPETFSDYRDEKLVPSSYILQIPAAGERPSHPPLSSSNIKTLAFWHAHLEAGLRFPIHPYLCEIADFFQVPLNQFVTNAIRAMLSFFKLIKGNGGGGAYRKNVMF